MEADSPASKTALMVCAYRARASARENPVCNDPWAAGLAGSDGMELAERFDRHFPHMEMWMALRTAYLDAQVRHWIAQGHKQVVVLGAGLDTRAARLASPGVRFFEVDFPSTQEEKRERLAALDGYPIDAAEYTECDFESDDFIDKLSEHGFDTDAPAVITWEGVVPYLTEEAVRGTCNRVAAGCHAETVLLFDFLGKRMAEGSGIKPKDEKTRQYVGDLGEPIRFGINDILPLLYDEGFRWVRSISFDEICLSLTGSYDRSREFRFQRIAVASRTVPPSVIL
jgi:methyltransferase (TIGR00027 family)